MKLDEMRLLVRVGETGSMTVAARQLHLSAAAVSATVKRVKESLSIRIFERTTRSLKPTSAGATVLAGCEHVLRQWQKTVEKVQAGDRQLTGKVQIAAPADTSYQLLRPVLVKLAARHPGLQLVVHSSDSLHHLHRDAIDLAIRYGPLEDSTLHARLLCRLPGVLVASPDYVQRKGMPQTPEELQAHQCVTLQLANEVVREWVLCRASEQYTVLPNSPLCGDGYLARQWALAGQGIARKSMLDVIDDLEAGRLVQVMPDFTTPALAVHALFPSGRYLPARARAVDEALSAMVASRTSRAKAWLRKGNGVA